MHCQSEEWASVANLPGFQYSVEGSGWRSAAEVIADSRERESIDLLHFVGNKVQEVDASERTAILARRYYFQDPVWYCQICFSK